jgi:N-acetyl-anhydromuramyl-L-alanine amidase AmpD
VNEPNDLFLPPKADRAWRYIVLHHSDHGTGSYAQIDRDHREKLGTQGCGYHFVVGNGSESPDGRVEVARRWLDQKAGAHCRDATVADANDYGIGVCLIGDMDEDPPTAKQVEATKALVAYLRDRYDIPAERVVSHAAIAQTATTCPGAKFPIDAIVNGRGFASR